MIYIGAYKIYHLLKDIKMTFFLYIKVRKSARAHVHTYMYTYTRICKYTYLCLMHLLRFPNAFPSFFSICFRTFGSNQRSLIRHLELPQSCDRDVWQTHSWHPSYSLVHHQCSINIQGVHQILFFFRFLKIPGSGLICFSSVSVWVQTPGR